LKDLLKRRRILIYRIAIITIVIVIVWVISPLTSHGILQIYGIDFWFRVFATVFYGVCFTGLIDIKGGMQKWKPHRPYLAPRLFYILMGSLGFVGGTVCLLFFNFVFVGGLFGNLLTIDLIVSISTILSITTMVIYGISYYRIFNEWYEELNRYH
jgi:hypothetical protein